MDKLFLSDDEITKIEKVKAEKNLSNCYNNIKDVVKVLERLFGEIDPLYLLKRIKIESDKTIIYDKDDEFTILVRKTSLVLLLSVFVSSSVNNYGREKAVRWKDLDKVYKNTERFIRELCFAFDNHLALLFLEGELKRENITSYRNVIYSRFFNPIIEEYKDDNFLSLRMLLSYKTSSFLSSVPLLEIITQIKKRGDDISMEGFSSFDITNEKENVSSYILKKGEGDFFSKLKEGRWEVESKPFFLFEGKVYSFLSKELFSFIYQDSVKYFEKATRKDLLLIFDEEEGGKFKYKNETINVKIIPPALSINSPLEDEKLKKEIDDLKYIDEKTLVVYQGEKDIVNNENLYILSPEELTLSCLDMMEKDKLLLLLFGDDIYSRKSKEESASSLKEVEKMLDKIAEVNSTENNNFAKEEKERKDLSNFFDNFLMTNSSETTDEDNTISREGDGYSINGKEEEEDAVISVEEISESNPELNLKEREEFNDDAFYPSEECVDSPESDEDSDDDKWFEEEIDDEETFSSDNDDGQEEGISDYSSLLENDDEGEKEELNVSSSSDDSLIKKICNSLKKEGKFCSFVSSSSKETVEMLNKTLNSSVEKQRLSGGDKILNIEDFSISLIISEDNIRDDLRMSELMNNAGGIMYLKRRDSWDVVIVHVGKRDNLELVLEKEIKKESFSPSDWKRVIYISERMREK